MPADDIRPPAQVASVPQEGTGHPRTVLVGAPRLSNTFAAFRHRNFRLFFAGQLVSLTGTWMQSTAQGWLVYELTGSKALLGTVAAVGSLPMMLLSILGGSVADRYPKRRVVLIAQSTMMMLAFTLAALVWSGRIRPEHILILAALNGVAMAFDMPARQAFMVELTSRSDLMNAISMNSSAVNAARVVGPAVAGFLIAYVGMEACFFLNGMSFLAVIAGLLMMRLPAFVRPQEPTSPGRHLLEGLRYVAGHRRIRILLLLFLVVGIFGWSYSVLLPAYARDVLKVGESAYGAMLSANGFGALLGALTVASYGARVHPRRFILGGLWVFSAMLVMISFVRWYPLVLVCMAVGGWGMLLYFATTNTVLQTSSEDSMRGRVMGIWALVFGGMMPLGGLESGLLSELIGVPWTITAGAVMCAGAGAVTWWAVRRNPLTRAEQRA